MLLVNGKNIGIEITIGLKTSQTPLKKIVKKKSTIITHKFYGCFLDATPGTC
jgi:hypothetical protein